ncbi:MAG TPA: hypothetical protein DDZ89_13325 [Clostridiales bacterium]|nr:hypothetical protein [Clostridiales bacterium]
MKKTIAMIVTVILLAALLVGCGSGGAVKTGLGHVVSIGSSKDATADANGAAQVDVTMAAVTIDSEGRIQKVTIDVIQGKVEVDKEGKIVTDKSTEIKSKVEIGSDYGLIKQSKIGRNWDEQIVELEKWMIGKTIEEIQAIKLKKVDDNHPSVPDEPDLTSKVTITVQDYIAAVAEAVKNAK